MATIRTQNSREQNIREYFFGNPPDRPLYILIFLIFFAAGTFLLLRGILGPPPKILFYGLGPGCIIVGVIVTKAIHISYTKKLRNYQQSKPTDRQIDQWLQESIVKLREKSLKRLNLDESEIIADPLVIRGPILWKTIGIDNGDLVWKIGSDDTVRFGIYKVTIIQLTDRHLGAYACDYNFIRDVALNERTDEYHYKDVVSVTTQEQASSYTLPTGVKLITAQEFRLSVSGGESINVIIGSSQISKITGSNQIPETGAEKAISVIRAMLRQKKE